MRASPLFWRVFTAYAVSLLITTTLLFWVAGRQRAPGVDAPALLALAIVIALPIAAAYSVAGPVERSLAELRAAAEGVARDRYDAQLAVTAGDELGKLSATFNRMTQALALRIGELRGNSQRLSTVLGSMIEGVIAVDQNQRILLANNAARMQLDIGPSDLNGRPLWEAVRNRSVQQVVDDAFERHGMQQAEIEVHGSQRRVLAAHATRLPGDPSPGVVLVLHDVTELRRLENLRQEFVANVSHELKTPLTAIKACAETLLDGALSDPQHGQSFLRQIEEQADRLHQLILDLLSLARIESGRERFQIQVVALAEFIDECQHHYAAKASSKNITLQVVPATAPLGVRADEEGLRQIVDNLVDNALKYTPAFGRVEIRWQAEDSQALIEVSDTGIGIPPHEQARIFERFYRVDKARSRELGGTGLGLSIVKHLVQEFGGSIGVTSQVGQGSTFSVRLPIA